MTEIEQQGADEGFRLSPQQRRLWTFMQAGDGDAFQARAVVEVRGPLDLERLKQACERLVQRYEILRTGFVCFSGMTIPLQVVRDSGDVGRGSEGRLVWHPPTVVQSMEQAKKVLQDVRFDLESGAVLHVAPVMVAPVTVESEEKSAPPPLFVMALPSLCADSATLDLLVEKIAEEYTQQAGEDASTPEATEDDAAEDDAAEEMQFIDLAEWQNGLLEEEDTSHWQDKQFLPTSRLPLPGELSQPTAGHFAPQTWTFQLATAETKETFQNQASSSLETFLLACWHQLLVRQGCRDEVTLGVAFAGRRYAELAQAPGLLERYLPLRLSSDGQQPWNQFLESVEEAWQGAEQSQEFFPFDEVLAQQGEEQGLEPFLPFAFSYHENDGENDALSHSAKGGVTTFHLVQCSVCTDLFRLRLSCVSSHQPGESITAELAYDPRFYPPAMVARLGEQLKTLVKNAAVTATTTTETPLAHVSFLSAGERQQILVEWNQNARPLDSSLLWFQRFEDWAQKTPQKTALVCDERQWTYETLNHKANQLAHHLQDHYLQDCGTGVESLVAICLERSLESLMALLAVQKARAAYVFMDPAQPAPRRAAMLKELEGPLLITRSALIEDLQPAPQHWVCLDRDRQTLAEESTENLSVPVAGDHLAYVLFTSGSTGRPKGVGVEHRQVLNYLEGILHRLDPPAAASFATVSTLAADLGNTAIFPALTTGGCLHLISFERSTDTAALADYFAYHGVDYLKIVPSHISALLDGPRGGEMLPRRGLLLGGELFRRSLAERLQQAADGQQIFNHYGPTETTVGVLTHELGSSEPWGASVPLGRPINNVRTYVLDPAFKPVAMGMPGELVIGGESLSRGYLRRPAETARRFVPDPWGEQLGEQPGGRLYRTGDRVRVLPDGHLEYLDRVDRQIKIRGFRVELGEVEAVLASHSGVDQAVCVVQSGADGAANLVAYVVLSRDSVAVDEGGLRSWTQKRLPPYMVPQAIVVLESLPLNANGKIDHKALPKPQVEEGESRGDQTAPSTPMEEILVPVWEQLLQVELVGTGDNFLELGGHSLLAMQLVTRVREICGVEIPLGDFLAQPTVAALAALVEARLGLGDGASLPAIAPQELGEEEQAPISFSQERYWRWRHPKPNTVSRNELRTYRFRGSFDLHLFRQALGILLARHQILRTSYEPAGELAVQVIHPQLEVQIPFIDLRQVGESHQEVLIRQRIDHQDGQLFDLEQPPLFRLTLFRLAEDEHLLLFVTHHIVLDGWSWEVLNRELVLLYKGLIQGEAAQLPELPVTYQDFALWQRRHFIGAPWDHQMEYWRRQLDGVIPSPTVPTDRPRPETSSYQGAVERFVISRDLTEKLQQVSRRQNVTLFVTLLATFKALLQRQTGEEEISLLSLFANRNRPEIENVAGCFMNVLPLRTHLKGAETFPELTARVRKTTLEAYSHPDIPFDRLVREIVLPQLSTKVHELAVFRLLFALAGSAVQLPTVPGLFVEVQPVKSDRMYNDFLVVLRPVDGRLMGTLKYNTDLFEQERMQGLYETYLKMLEAVAEDPDRRLEEL